MNVFTRLRLIWVIALLPTVSGCSWLTFGLLGDDADDQPRRFKQSGPTVGQVVNRLPELNIPKTAPIKPTRDEVMAAYNRVYGMIPSVEENYAVGKRLADLHMEVGEDLDIEGQSAPYDSAVQLYEQLLVDAEQGGNVDEILYQLARAHDLSTQSEQSRAYLDRLISEYPDSAYVAEARFRRAEMRFSNEQYREASEDYGYVVNLGNSTPYYRNSAYMLGWAEFKRSRFDEGLHQFFNVVDDVFGTESVSLTDIDQLDSVERELVTDTFRVVTLAVAYLDGPMTLADEMRRRGKPDWQFLAYQHLADDYFLKERYLDNVATWQAYIEHNSLDARAPAAHKGMIKTLMDAGFPSDVLPKKREYVARYGVYSEFWSHHDEEVRASYLPTLHEYLSELAKLAHAEAQTFDSDPKARKGIRDKAAKRLELYLAAAQWYEEIIVTFPADPRTAEYLFLLGESYTEAQEYGRAVAAYQRVIREFPADERAQESGYAAILGLSELVGSASQEELELWQRLKIDAQIEFALLFPGDDRAPAVQTDAANTLFALGHVDESIELANNLLAEWPDVDASLRKTALLILGHGHFEKDQFVIAEQAYHELLGLSLTSDERAKVDERLLASVYKQGEAAEAAQDSDGAVHHYLRLSSLAPGSALAAKGHFDAVAVVEGAGRLDEAAQMLVDFRQIYPDHELSRGLDARLASMYEQTQDWRAAAAEYTKLASSANEQDVRRSSLYRAGELYLELDDVPAAIEAFRDYAHKYEEPAPIALEAMHHMDELYQRTGDADKRRFWLDKKIKLHAKMGSAATERATYLAASAQYVFAEDQKASYQSIALTRPLKRSLRKKQAALKKTLAAYEKVAAYEVAEFTTASTFEIGDLYSALSRSIMASERPQNLNALELEQYEILLEEQAYPFEEQAIALHEINMERAWSGVYDDWVKKSFAELKRLMPGRFDKREKEVAYVGAIH